MVNFMKAFTKMTKNTVLEFILGQTVKSTQGGGLMANKMVTVFTNSLTELKSMVFGRKGKSKNGYQRMK